jgi:hypothetical protein
METPGRPALGVEEWRHLSESRYPSTTRSRQTIQRNEKRLLLQESEMTDPHVKVDVFLSEDKRYIFTRCCFIFESITIGDFEQIILGKNLIGVLEDLIFRLEEYSSIDCEPDKLEETLSSLINNDIRHSCLPLGIEAFDGDTGAFFSVAGDSYIVLKPWGRNNIFTEKMSISHYLDIITLSKKILASKIHDLQNEINEPFE